MALPTLSEQALSRTLCVVVLTTFGRCLLLPQCIIRGKDTYCYSSPLLKPNESKRENTRVFSQALSNSAWSASTGRVSHTAFSTRYIRLQMCAIVCALCIWLLGLCARIRQGVVNRLIGCELRTYGPLLSKGRLAKRCFCCSNRLLKRIAFRWWKRCLRLLAHCYRC
jgi:hypothetical protein